MTLDVPEFSDMYTRAIAEILTMRESAIPRQTRLRGF